jgi:hypothetical protein
VSCKLDIIAADESHITVWGVVYHSDDLDVDLCNARQRDQAPRLERGHVFYDFSIQATQSTASSNSSTLLAISFTMPEEIHDAYDSILILDFGSQVR